MKNNRHVPLLANSKLSDLKSHSVGSHASFSWLHDMSDIQQYLNLKIEHLTQFRQDEVFLQFCKFIL